MVILMEIDSSDILDISVLVFFPIFLIIDHVYGQENISAALFWGLVVCFFVLVGTGAYLGRRSRAYTDERNKRVDVQAGYNAFWVLVILFFVGVLKDNSNVGFFLGLLTYYTSRFYYNKIGLK